MQLPPGFLQIALRKRKALQNLLDFLLCAAGFFFPHCQGLLTHPFLDGLTVDLKSHGPHSRKLLSMFLDVYCLLVLARCVLVDGLAVLALVMLRWSTLERLAPLAWCTLVDGLAVSML